MQAPVTAKSKGPPETPPATADEPEPPPGAPFPLTGDLIMVDRSSNYPSAVEIRALHLPAGIMQIKRHREESHVYRQTCRENPSV